MTGQIRWTPSQHKDKQVVSTTLNLFCSPDGHITMESPSGEFSSDYSSVQEAQAGLATLCEQGINEAQEGSSS